LVQAHTVLLDRDLGGEDLVTGINRRHLHHQMK